jgi:RND superfamily putative drug exporter
LCCWCGHSAHLLLPLKAVLLNLLSLGATYGLIVLLWQHGVGSEAVFDLARTGAVTFWVPLMAFAFLFGLSMDYEVFILARMREEYDATGSTDRAVIQGMGRTGRRNRRHWDHRQERGYDF